ncbi:MAG: hypothetical protein ACXWMX_01770 [Candidatus Limnocylindrales bacterium]
MTLPTLPRGWWGSHRSPPHSRSIAELIGAGTVDAQLAALLWLLIEARVPLVVAAGPPLAGKSTILTALIDFLPPGVRRIYLRGRVEDFAWLPEAGALGWHGDGLLSRPDASSSDPRPAGGDESAPTHPASSYLLAAELSDRLSAYTWGRRARTLVRAASRGYGVGTTIRADSLAEVMGQLQAPPVGLTEDELRALGVVLVLGLVGRDGQRLLLADGSPEAKRLSLDPNVGRRIVAAHYLRPPERDAGGHVQRRPPAVLATWDAGRDCFEHFAWGIVPELGERTGRTSGDFEREQARRAAALAGLAAAAPASTEAVRATIAAIRAGGPPPASISHAVHEPADAHHSTRD